MITRVLRADARGIQEAALLIKCGQVVGFPTETVYGLGANALDESAVAKIFEAKGRPGDNPLIVHIARLDQIGDLIEGGMPETAGKLARAFWPGPLTMVLRKSAAVPDLVSAGLDTVGVRMPGHPVARALIEACGVPIAAPSANLSGRPSPTTAQHVLEDMDARVPLILDGGACDVGLESTVLDVTKFPPRVLRPGSITPEMIAGALGAVDVDEHVLSPLGEHEVAASPGMKHRHYAPKGALSIVTGSPERVREKIIELYDRAGGAARILALQDRILLYGSRAVYSLGSDERQAARALFSALREMDEHGVELILAEGFETAGMGLALMNRLARAAGFHIVDAGV